MVPVEPGHPDELVLRVEGMSCGHCKAAVIKEVDALDGVDSVSVSLESGELRVRGRAEAEAVKSVVEEAGYEAHPA